MSRPRLYEYNIKNNLLQNHKQKLINIIFIKKQKQKIKKEKKRKKRRIFIHNHIYLEMK
jgi:transcription antitermination factor NusG